MYICPLNRRIWVERGGTLVNFPQELAVIFTAALPISELRGAIPMGVGAFHFPIYKAYGLSLVGNLIPVIPILFLLERVSQFLSTHSRLAERFFEWLFAHTRRRSRAVEKYGAIGLILFVAIPLPITGAWTGCVAAFLFGIRKNWAVLCITLGVILAGIIVSFATLGVISVF